MMGFIKIVLGNLVALMLFGLVGLVFFGAALTGLFMQEEAGKVEHGSVLIFDLSANLTDSPPGEDVWRALEEAIGPKSAPTYSLRAVTDSIRAAAEDESISSIFLQGHFIPEGYGSGFSALRELRMALLEFKESGKPLIAYVENPTVRDYYVASAADRILMNPYGMVGLSGLASQQIFIAGALERYGVGVQVTRAGRYKAAVEMFTEQTMSEDNRTQTRELLDDLWGGVLAGVSESRGLAVEELQRLADEHGFLNPEVALEHGLVDGIGYLDQVLEELRGVSDAEGRMHFPQVDMNTYLTARAEARSQRAKSRNTIAIVYVEGDIVDGEGMPGTVGGNRFAREIRRLRQDGTTRALVIRVNSPGGSVSAAETIQREIRLARESMPVVVSFGSVAASGGYWIATESDRIYSQPNTITGSIGVFGIIPNLKEIANRHGVTFDSVRTAKFADIFSLTRPKTEEEMGRIQDIVDQIYQDFLERVASGRDMTVEQVHELAQGRIWSGQEALRLGLVDEIGGLAEAIAYAGEEAGLEKWSFYEFPRPTNFTEALAEMFSPEQVPLMARERDPFESFRRELQTELRSLQLLNDPRGVYVRLPFSLRIQ